jgi:hypothetical protein
MKQNAPQIVAKTITLYWYQEYINAMYVAVGVKPAAMVVNALHA